MQILLLIYIHKKNLSLAVYSLLLSSSFFFLPGKSIAVWDICVLLKQRAEWREVVLPFIPL